jgi:hypothetical protein
VGNYTVLKPNAVAQLNPPSLPLPELPGAVLARVETIYHPKTAIFPKLLEVSF